MGYYIETGSAIVGKANIIAEKHGATIIDEVDAVELIDDMTKAIIVVVNNGPFEAAAFAFNMDELSEFTRPDDPRTRTFLVMDRALAKKLTGYTGD